MNALNIRKFFPYTPEVLLLTGAVVCLVGEWLATSHVNGLMVVGVLSVVALLIWKSKYLALSMAILLGVVSICFLFAVLSEFHEFPVDHPERWQMLLAGGVIFGSLLVVSVILPRKYFSSNEN